MITKLTKESLIETELSEKNILEKRDSLYREIVGSAISSKRTGLQGTITKIEQKNVEVNFTCWESVPMAIATVNEYLELGDELNQKVNEFVETFAVERRIKRLKNLAKRAAAESND